MNSWAGGLLDSRGSNRLGCAMGILSNTKQVAER
jgi:hypothetical protein